MRILFDGPYSPEPTGGVLKYFNEISKILQINSNNRIYFSRYSNLFFSTKITLPLIPHFRPHKFSFFLEYLCYKILHHRKINIVHPVEFQLSPAGKYFVKKGAKIVITIHDLIHEKFGAPGDLYSRESRLSFYEKADGFIFVSNSTRNDFKEFYPSLFSSKPSKVIWHGRNFELKKNPKNKYSKQFLFIGSRSGYKNFNSAIHAFSKLVTLDPSVKLVVAGAPPETSEKKLVEKIKTHVVWKTFPKDDDLKKLYRSSLALLYTSNYEGFGMPLLEAMSQGCIPIAGKHSSIPEVLDSAGILLKTDSVKEIYSALQSCLSDKKFVMNLKELGYLRTLKFSWDKTANQTLKFYKSL